MEQNKIKQCFKQKKFDLFIFVIHTFCF